MYCKICGQESPDDKKICIYCGSPCVSQTVVPDLEGNSEEMDPGYDLERDSSSGFSINFKRIFYLVCAGSAVLIAILLCFPGFRAFVIRNFASPKVLMNTVYCQTAENIISCADLSDSLSPGDNICAQYISDIQLGDDMLSLLSDSLQVDVQSIQGLSDIQLVCNACHKDKSLYALYELNIQDNDILSVEQHIDTMQSKQYVRIPELSSDYLMIDMQSKSSFYDIFNRSDVSVKIKPELLNEVVQYYIELIISGFDNINRSKQTVCLNGVSQRLTVLQATISIDQFYNLSIEVLEDASENPNIIRILRDMEEQTGQLYYDEFMSSVSLTIDHLKQTRDNVDFYGDYTVYTYLDRGNNIVGFGLSYTEDSMTGEIASFISVSNEKQFALEASLFGQYLIQGTGVAGKEIEGTFSVFVSDELVCGIIINDFSVDSRGVFGSIKLVPDEEIVEHLMDKSGYYQAYLNAGRLKDFSIEYILNWSNEQKTISVYIYSGEKLLVSNCSKINIISDSSELLSNNPIGDHKITDSAHWLKTIDEKSMVLIMDRLKKAGIIWNPLGEADDNT